MARKSTGRRSTGRASKTPAEKATSIDTRPNPAIDWTSPPTQVKLPTIAKLSSMTDDELSEILKRFGISSAWPKMKADAQAYLSRMTSYPPGSPEWNRALAALTEASSRRALLGMTRQAYREYGVFEALSSDDARYNGVETELVRICEYDDASCDGCLERAGEIGTRSYHEKIGSPGNQDCGANCRCELIPVD